MKDFFTFLLVASSTNTGNSREFKKHGKVRRSVEEGTAKERNTVTVYTSRDAFNSALARFDVIANEETFSTYLQNDTVADLAVGENTVGSFDIDIDADSTAMTVSEGENNLGAFDGAYQKDVQTITFDNFENGKLYAFAATWDIEQQWSDYVDDDWRKVDGGGSKDGNGEGSKDAKGWDDDWGGSDGWGYWGGGDWGGWGGGDGGAGGGTNWGDRGKLLHLAVGRNKFNLVEILYREQTKFIGFISLEGFTSMTFFTPESVDEAIEFEMSNVLVSDGKAGYDNLFEYYFSIVLQVLEFFFTADISGLFDFLAQLFGNNSGDN